MDSAELHQLADKKWIIPDSNGKKYEYKPKGLKIIWGKDSRHWKIHDEAAELLQVSWLEVTGTLDVASKLGNKYKISFEISFEPYAFGWEGIPIYVMAKLGKRGKYMGKTFSPYKENNTGNEKLTFDFSVESRDTSDPTLYFGLYEVFSGVWKGGLKIYKAIVEES